MGTPMVVDGFLVVVVGGVGSLFGSVLRAGSLGEINGVVASVHQRHHRPRGGLRRGHPDHRLQAQGLVLLQGTLSDDSKRQRRDRGLRGRSSSLIMLRAAGARSSSGSIASPNISCSACSASPSACPGAMPASSTSARACSSARRLHAGDVAEAREPRRACSRVGHAGAGLHAVERRARRQTGALLHHQGVVPVDSVPESMVRLLHGDRAAGHHRRGARRVISASASPAYSSRSSRWRWCFWCGSSSSTHSR